MANITLTDLFATLPDWPGRLFEAPNGTVLISTAKKFIFQHPAGSGPFANFQVEVTGAGFSYDAGEPIGGRMTSVRVLNPAGDTVITFANLGNNELANDLSQFYASVFGTRESDGSGVFPQPESAWSHLLAGRDTITGSNGNDWRGTAGFDPGNDVYNMRGGDDYIDGGLGNDTIYGGEGYDIFSFGETNWAQGAAAIRGATINVQTGVVLDPWGGRDVVSGVEEFRGSRLADTFIGSNTERDRFSGGRGRDTMDGGNNTFTSTGDLDGDRRDAVFYDQDARDGGRRGIVVDLETSFANGSIRGTIRDGFGNLDTVIDIERVFGTRFNDTFVGSRANNVFAGDEGRDSFDGGDGFDSLNFDRQTGNNGPTAGLRIDFSRAAGQILNDGYGNVETAIGMEAVWGSRLNDSVRGSSGDEELWLNEGRDTMTGGGGVDTFVWNATSEFGQGDRVTDFKASGPGADKLAFYTPDINGMTTTLTLVNGTAATQAGVGTFIFNAANDTLFWDGDGAGGAAAVAIVLLSGVNSLSASNFDLWT